MEGVDAGYLYMETPAMHMHTLKIALVEPAECFDPAYFTEVVLERLADLPAFSRRVLPAPFGLNHPLWIADRPIDPARHIFVHQVPAPGGMAGLEKLIGEIGSTPLDRSVPLWELHVTEPLRRHEGRGRGEDAPRPRRRGSGQRAAVPRDRRGARRRGSTREAAAREDAVAAHAGTAGPARPGGAGARPPGTALPHRARRRGRRHVSAGARASRCRARSSTRRARR